MIKKFSNYHLSLRPKIRLYKSPLPIWLNRALGELGQAEIAGKDSNPKIGKYLASVELERNDDIPWCSAFVNWIIKKSGFKGTNKGLARSWQHWGEPLDEAILGCIAVLRRGTKPWQGHVGFVMDINPRQITLLGGNQGNRVGINAYPKSLVLDYRWPKK